MDQKALLNQLVTCGNLIEKKRESFKTRGIQEEVLLGGLDAMEQEQLEQLLTKLKQYWMEAHKKAHQNGAK